MKRLIFSFFVSAILFTTSSAFSQRNDAATSKVAAYLESIRNKESALTAFFQLMPKGGDLHHHFSGSVYAEEMFEIARANNFYVDLQTWFVYPQQSGAPASAVSIRDYKGPVNIRENLINLWSVKDFKNVSEASDDHFFNTFGYFAPTIWGNEIGFLKAIKERSIKENIQYIETMLVRPNYDRTNAGVRVYLSSYDSTLLYLQSARNESELKQVFDRMRNQLTTDLQFSQYADAHTSYVKNIESQSHLPVALDTNILIRYQNYVSRTSEPSDVFAQLLLSFMTVDNSMILGVNIVAPEDNEVSMRDYWLHSEMFAYFHKLYPNVKYSMHAGELTLGLVKPEDLTWHIRTAVMTAGAKRIGHGVDLAYEQDMRSLVKYMKENGIAIEINLASNQFILGVTNERHPFPLYFKYGVPIVISTDDAGVLRSNHTEQFVLLANRYKEVKYTNIKQFAYNSTNYSFLPVKVKQLLRQRLDTKFANFEQQVVRQLQN